MDLEMLRSAVEDKDREIIRFIAERMKIVQEIAFEKERLGLPVRISDQAMNVLKRAEDQAVLSGLDPSPVKEIFSILIQMSEESQSQRRKK
jgi:chorismate mutase